MLMPAEFFGDTKEESWDLAGNELRLREKYGNKNENHVKFMKGGERISTRR